MLNAVESLPARTFDRSQRMMVLSLTSSGFFSLISTSREFTKEVMFPSGIAFTIPFLELFKTENVGPHKSRGPDSHDGILVQKHI